jgi:hypothetical protein
MRRSEDGQRFLQWWANKLTTKCVIDHAAGYFVDQRFVDLAITLFPGFNIEKETGYNVAYWNLHSRAVSQKGDSWTCNGGPLYFFHFSGYKVERPNVMCGYISRFDFQQRPDCAAIFQHYRRLLMENGYEHSHLWPYSFSQFTTGERIAYQTRARYRRLLAVGLGADDPFNSAAMRWHTALSLKMQLLLKKWDEFLEGGKVAYRRLRHWSLVTHLGGSKAPKAS